jgi:hypothetical protein
LKYGLRRDIGGFKPKMPAPPRLLGLMGNKKEHAIMAGSHGVFNCAHSNFLSA